MASQAAIQPAAPRAPGINRRVIEALTGYLFIAPYLIVATVFLFGAMLYALYISFTDLKFFLPKDGLAGLHLVGLDNYASAIDWEDLTAGNFKAFFDTDFFVALRNTIYFSAVVVFFQTWLAIILAVALNAKIAGKQFFRVSWYVPSITSSVVISLVFIWLYLKNGVLNFLINTFFGWAGVSGPDWLNDTRTALPAIMLMNIFTTVPTFMVMFLAALQDIPDEIYEAAKLDGATGATLFWKVTLPLLRPVTFLVVVLGTIGTLQVFDQIYIMTNAGGPLRSTLTISYLIYQDAFKNSLMSQGAAEAVILFIIIFCLFLVQRRALDQGGQV
jgi:multiple sugar transport system permease protein